MPPFNRRDGPSPSSVYTPERRLNIAARFLVPEIVNSTITVTIKAPLPHLLDKAVPGCSPLHDAIINGPDIPLLKALLRTREDPNAGASSHLGAPIVPAVLTRSQMFACGCTQDAGAMLKAIEILLSVGADPTASSTVTRMRGCTLLQEAIQVGDMELTEVLLNCPLSGRMLSANLVDAAEEWGQTPAVRHQAKRLIQAAQKRKTPRPILCQCLSGRTPSECHDHPDGALCHPQQPCPCKGNVGRFNRNSKWKTYEKCCQKAGVVFREDSAGHTCEVATIEGDSAVGLKKYAEAQLAALRAQGLSDKEIREQPMFPGVSLQQVMQQQSAIYDTFVPDLVAEGAVDPAFSFAMYRMDWQLRVWRTVKHFGIPVHEQKVRQREWNEAVDVYIGTSAANGDPRSALDISKAAKIHWNGGALFAVCPGCNKEEDRPACFQQCSRCRATRYCSQACQKEHWKQHKLECSTDSAFHILPSLRAVEPVLLKVMAEMEKMQSAMFSV